MDSTHLFSFALLIVSAVMAYFHHRVWLAKRTAIDDCKTDDRAADVESQLEFADRRYRRRMQVSAMLGIVALAMFASRWIDPWRRDAPWIYMAYWLVIVILVLWVTLLAMADYVATRHFLAKSHQDQIIEDARLRAETRRMSGPESGKTESKLDDDAGVR